MKSSFELHFRKCFLTGVLTAMPLPITLLVFQFLFRIIRNLFSPVLIRFFPDTPLWLKYWATFLAVLFLLYFLGLLTSRFLGRWFWTRFESILLKIPLLRSVYSVSREVVRIFAQPQETGYQDVALVEFPRPGMKAVGFVTGMVTDEQGKLHYKVFIPTTPNPTTGFLEILEASQVVRSNLSVEEGIRIIMSGGILGPKRMNLHTSVDRLRSAGSEIAEASEERICQ